MKPASSSFANAFGSFTLHRLPLVNNPSLRAWDAADELLLNTLHEQALLEASQTRLLIINDSFGALSVSLNEYSPHNWSDSYQSHLAVTHNLTSNELSNLTTYVPSTQEPDGKFDVVLIKIPKTIALLEYQLITLKPHISADTTIIAAGMVKHIHTSTLKLFEKILGTTTTSLAKKKARLVFSSFDKTDKTNDNKPTTPPYPKSFYNKEIDMTLSNHANVFAKDKLDIGARFMLEQFKQLPASKHIVDLGCGNGVLGLVAKRQLPDSHVTFIDESYMAIDSAKENYKTIIGDKQADFLLSDTLSNLKDDQHDNDNVDDNIDLILCNPPFHQQHTMGDYLAWEMFKQSLQYLTSGGSLWVVSNRHLGYHVKLKKLFGNCKTLASNKKFVVLVAKKR